MKYHRISKYPEYSYTKDGQIWHNDPAYKVLRHKDSSGNIYVFLNNTPVYLESLFAFEYFGELLNLPIYYKDKNSENFSSENMYYQIPLDKIAQFESPYTQFVKLGDQLFKRIPKYSNYFISEYGVVYGIWWKKIIVQSTDKDGYRFVRLAGIKKSKTLNHISRLVYETFVGEIGNGYVIDHYDGKIFNNHVENLSSLTVGDNNLKGHSYDMRKGLYSPNLIHRICKLISNGYSIESIFEDKMIREIFRSKESLSAFCIGLLKGLYFRDISLQYDLRNFHFNGYEKRKYLQSQIDDVCKYFQMGMPYKEISSKLGIPISSIKSILLRYRLQNP